MLKMRHEYSDAEVKKILSNIIILCDTREKCDMHILEWFGKKKIPYKKHKLDYGDYSFCVLANDIMGTIRDTYFDRSIIVERKANLDELSGNLAQQRERFEHEFLRAKDCKKVLLIEGGSLSDIWNHKYNTQFNPASYMASILTFQERYNLQTVFLEKHHSAQYIYGLFYYHLREALENK